MIRLALAALAFVANAAAGAAEPVGLHSALEQLAREGKFSGAIVIRDAAGVRFARGYGMADPFTGRPFTPETPIDSASLAKPVTAAAILALARDGKLKLDLPVRTYLPEYPQPTTTVRHLLAHSAGLPEEAVGDITGKTNAQLLAAVSAPNVKPLFAPGTAFSYCNLCYSTLALLIERVSGRDYLEVAREKAALPEPVRLRPARLADWSGRAIGYRTGKGAQPERADSYEDELFYGSGNLSISAHQLARWGSHWWSRRLASIRPAATAPALIGGRKSGLTLGNWYCASAGNRCHYLGHHEGFHHMLYWDADRRMSVAMVTNNTLAPAIQQRLQRTLVAFANGRQTAAAAELRRPLRGRDVAAGEYSLPTGETLRVTREGKRVSVDRNGLRYAAYPIGDDIRYVPGLDIYLAGTAEGGVRWLSLYEDMTAKPARRRR